MNLNFSTSLHSIAAIFFIIMTGDSFAQEWVAPTEITFKGVVYSLAFKNKDNHQQQTYEYTANKESVENWNSLFSVIFIKRPNAPFTEIAYNIASTLNVRNPKPRYNIYEKNHYLMSRIIYDFTNAKSLPYFESNVRKTFYSPSCGGFFDVSFALKRMSKSDVSATSILDDMLAENEAMANELVSHLWKPTCGNQNAVDAELTRAGSN